MTLILKVKIDLSTTEYRALIERAVRVMIFDAPDYPEVHDPDDYHCIVGIIDDVEVRVGI